MTDPYKTSKEIDKDVLVAMLNTFIPPPITLVFCIAGTVGIFVAPRMLWVWGLFFLAPLAIWYAVVITTLLSRDNYSKEILSVCILYLTRNLTSTPLEYLLRKYSSSFLLLKEACASWRNKVEKKSV